MKLDSDFVADLPCLGHGAMPFAQRVLLSLVCRVIGHNLWRVMNTARKPDNHSLDHYGVYCRRCYRGGYVQGDYRP